MRKLFGIVLVLAVVLSFSLVSTTQVSAAVINVPLDQPDIQAAINNANPGDTIIVAPGTYIGNITIDKRLTITGAGSGSDPGSNTIITPDAPGTSVVTISAAGASATERLTLSNLRVEGGDSHGIRITAVGSYITFDDVASVGHGNRGVSGEWSGVAQDMRFLNCSFSLNLGVAFRTGSSAQIRGLIMTETSMCDNDFGAYLDGAVTGVAITGGHFDRNLGAGTSGVGIWAQRFDLFDDADKLPNVLTGFAADNNRRGVILHTYGPFEISDASVSNNLEEGITFNTRATGPGLITMRNVTAIDNPKSNLWAIKFGDTEPISLSIEDCTLSGSSGDGFPGWGYGLYLYAAHRPWNDVNVSGCTMKDNNIGVYMRALSATASITGVSILCSRIESNGTGILITEHAASGNTAKYNDISGNTLGVQNNSASVFDARDNWWGADDGPGPVAFGSGDNISANVLYDPWINKSVATATGTGTALFSPSEGNMSSLEAVPAISPAPRGVTFPHGMFEFEICCLTPGQTVEVTITLPAAVEVGTVWWKHDGTSWYSLPNLADNGDNIMVIELTDGGLGDADGTANGVITDPGGPGNPVPPLTVGGESSSVDKAAVAAPWIALLAAMMAGALFVIRRRRAQT